MSNNIDETLAERGERYGKFEDQASLSQQLKRTMHSGRNWQRMSDDKREALEMVQHKIARILNGDPDYHDSWHDIIGYIRLVEEHLKPQP